MNGGSKLCARIGLVAAAEQRADGAADARGAVGHRRSRLGRGRGLRLDRFDGLDRVVARVLARELATFLDLGPHFRGEIALVAVAAASSTLLFLGIAARLLLTVTARLLLTVMARLLLAVMARLLLAIMARLLLAAMTRLLLF